MRGRRAQVSSLETAEHRGGDSAGGCGAEREDSSREEGGNRRTAPGAGQERRPAHSRARLGPPLPPLAGRARFSSSPNSDRNGELTASSRGKTGKKQLPLLSPEGGDEQIGVRWGERLFQ